MGVIHKTTVVPYKAEQMYTLVNDIEAYPVFVPWCNSAVLHEQEGERLVATLAMGIGKVKQKVTTENKMQPGRRIDVSLVEGPFKYLRGHWSFDDIEDAQCRVSMHLDFEFKNKMLKLTLNKAYEQINAALIDVFTRRAHEIYGTRQV